MKRIPEPELMVEPEQVIAYAEADFGEPHGHFIRLFEEAFLARKIEGLALDLGCGPGDISFRFAAAFPDCGLHAVDGSLTMLQYARQRLDRSPSIGKRISFFEGRLPDLKLPLDHYDYVISNSLLHHLQDPDGLWSVVKRYARSGSGVFIMDLVRPEDSRTAKGLVDSYAANEPEILRRDFYNSLLAAFTLDEIFAQLAKNELEFLSLTQVSDRHCTVSGRLP
ncbi:MAG: class I SAM-dependent methyltransferase [Gammaproteobacteria bacterium]